MIPQHYRCRRRLTTCFLKLLRLAIGPQSPLEEAAIERLDRAAAWWLEIDSLSARIAGFGG